MRDNRPKLRYPCPSCGVMREGVAVKPYTKCYYCALETERQRSIRLRTTIPVYHYRVVGPREIVQLRREDIGCWLDQNVLVVLSRAGCL